MFVRLPIQGNIALKDVKPTSVVRTEDGRCFLKLPNDSKWLVKKEGFVHVVSLSSKECTSISEIWVMSEIIQVQVIEGAFVADASGGY
jgi:predicted RNA-binding protein with RPS1 domain